MNNIYDVILNFNDYYYEVYEWKNTDDIKNVRKIPFFKVNDNVYLNLRNKNVKISEETYKLLSKNSNIFDEDVNNITCLITNEKASMGIIIDKKGYVIGRSAMLYDEEDEVVMESRNIKEIQFSFDYVEDIDYSSRLEREKKEVLLKFINNTSDKMILKYIYYDYYLVECDNINKIKEDIICEIKTNDSNKLFKLYKIVMLFYNFC